MAISGFISIPEWGRDSEREEGGAYPTRLRPQDAEEVVGKRRRHIRSALPDTQNHPIVSAWEITLYLLHYHFCPLYSLASTFLSDVCIFASLACFEISH